MRSLVLSVFVFAIAACSGSAQSNLSTPCVVGSSQACACDAGQGVQVCGANGVLLSCVCGSSSDTGLDAPRVDAVGPHCTADAAALCSGRCGVLQNGCGAVVDCGGCTAGETCGGSSVPNTCGTGACTPSCTGKSCGESDGCGGKCSAGTCLSGQECVNDACVCNATSCANGCCSDGACIVATSASACGRGGGACVTCQAGTCNQGVCSCGTTGAWTACTETPFNFTTCRAYCTSLGKCCTNTCTMPGTSGQLGAWTDSFSSDCSPDDTGSVAGGACDDSWGGGDFWFQCCCS